LHVLPLYLLASALTQKLKKTDKVILSDLEAEIHYLADDKLEGRRVGTNGEKLAGDFIIGEFEKNKFTTERVKISDGCSLLIFMMASK